LGFISQLSALKWNYPAEQLRGLKKFYKRKYQNKDGIRFGESTRITHEKLLKI